MLGHFFFKERQVEKVFVVTGQICKLNQISVSVKFLKQGVTKIYQTGQPIRCMKHLVRGKGRVKSFPFCREGYVGTSREKIKSVMLQGAIYLVAFGLKNENKAS